MKLYSAIVNLPKQSHSEHAIIDSNMYAFQNKIIIISKMNPDADYQYHSYHKKSRRLWWWNERWLEKIKPIAEYTRNYNIMDLDDTNNSIIDNINDLKEVKEIFIFLEKNYKDCAISKRYDAKEISQEMYLKANKIVNPVNMKRSLKLFGLKTKRLD